MSQRSWTTLRKRADFLRLQQQGKKWVTPGFIIQVSSCLDGGTPPGIGFTATKRLGNAVIRNRCKRRLRALCEAEITNTHLDNRQFVLIARPDAMTLDFVHLSRDLRWALRKLDVVVRPSIAA